MRMGGLSDYRIRKLAKGSAFSGYYHSYRRHLLKTEQDSITLISEAFMPAFLRHRSKKGFTDPVILAGMCRVIKELHPISCLAKMLVTSSMGLNKTIIDLEKAGYAVWTFVLPACSVGAWHERTNLLSWGQMFHALASDTERVRECRSSPICGLFRRKKTGHRSAIFRGNLLSEKDVDPTPLQSGVGRG